MRDDHHQLTYLRFSDGRVERKAYDPDCPACQEYGGKPIEPEREE